MSDSSNPPSLSQMAMAGATAPLAAPVETPPLLLPLYVVL